MVMKRPIAPMSTAALVAGLLLAASAEAQQAPAASPRAQTPLAETITGEALEGVAALVNDDVISFTDVRNRARLILLSLGVEPDEQTALQAQQRAIDSLIEEKLQLAEFKKLTEGKEITEAEIDQSLNNIARQNGVTLEAFLGDLAARGINPQTLRDQTRADLAWRQIVGGRYGSRIRVSKLQIDDMMERTVSSMTQAQYRIAEIFLPAPDEGSKQRALEGAAALRRQIEQGAPFQLVAQQFSAAPSASTGGELGWIAEGDLRPEFKPAVLAATPPLYLEPIVTEDGVYLLAYIDRRAAADASAAKLLLKQFIARGPGAEAQLTAARAAAASCDDMERAAGPAGVTAVNLGEVTLSTLSEEYRAALVSVEAGGVAGPLDLPNGKSLVYVCARNEGDAAVPTREQISDRIFESQISMLADRYLRDLKREATIIRR